MRKSAPSKQAQLKIALLITELQMGGAAKVVRDHAAAFRNFADVREIVFNRADGIDFEGEHVVSLEVPGGGGLVKRLSNFMRRVIRYGRFKDEWKPDVSIAHLEGAHYVDLLSRRGEKNILVMHGSIDHNRDIAGVNGWVRRRLLMPLAFRAADAIVAVSRGIAAEIASMELANVRVINNFFDSAVLASLAAEPLGVDHRQIFGSDVPVIVSMGRLAPEKNLGSLLGIFASVRARRSVRLLLIGDGPQRGALIERAIALGLTVSSPWTGLNQAADVHFVGNQSNPFALMARSTIFAMPSRWEGFPLALCEALACAIPVVASDCPTGPREILSPHSAIPTIPIVAPEAAPFGMLMPIPWESATASVAWTSTLEKLLHDEEARARISEAGARRVRDLSITKVAPQWRALVEELMASQTQKI